MVERSDIQRRLRRAKDSERRLGRFLIENNGPDPKLRPGGGVVTTTGRVGHITGLMFDVLSLDYAAENKQEHVPATWWKYWLKIVAKAIEQGKQPLLRVEPTNDDTLTVLGRPVPIIHMITESRHKELLGYERMSRELAPLATVATVARPPSSLGYSKEDQLRGHPKKAKR